MACGVVSVLFCVLVDVGHDRVPLPPSVHFILFGAGKKFNRTDWNPTPIVPLIVTFGLAAGGRWVAMCMVTMLQVARANRWLQKIR